MVSCQHNFIVYTFPEANNRLTWGLSQDHFISVWSETAPATALLGQARGTTPEHHQASGLELYLTSSTAFTVRDWGFKEQM